MKQPSDTPWWQATAEPQQFQIIARKSNSNFFVAAVVIALVAGGLGSVIGRGSATNIGAN